MTSVATWVNLEPGGTPSIWTAADTKITHGSKTITLEGAKVFELPVSCKRLGGNSYGEVYYKTSLGFSYAGSSMIGLNTYATLSSILSNLGSGPGKLPDHESIVNKARVILRVYAISVQDYAEITIWGFCPISHLPFVGTIRTVVDTEISYPIEIQHGYTQELHCNLIGSHQAEIAVEIAERSKAQSSQKKHDYWRTPIKVLRDIIKERRYDEIGGNIQLAILPLNGTFGHFGISVPIQGPTSEVHTHKYRNIDQFEDIGLRLGECIIAIPTLIIDFPEKGSAP